MLLQHIFYRSEILQDLKQKSHGIDNCLKYKDDHALVWLHLAFSLFQLVFPTIES